MSPTSHTCFKIRSLYAAYVVSFEMILSVVTNIIAAAEKSKRAHLDVDASLRLPLGSFECALAGPSAKGLTARLLFAPLDSSC